MISILIVLVMSSSIQAAGVRQSNPENVTAAPVLKPIGQFRHDGRPSFITLSRDGTLVAISCHHNDSILRDTVEVFDVYTGRRQWTAGRLSGVTVALAFSPDGRILATGAA